MGEESAAPAEWEAPKEAAVLDKPLIVGGIIYLSVNRDDFDGYIASEGKVQCSACRLIAKIADRPFAGFVDNRISVIWFPEGSGTLPEHFSQSLFRVVPKRSYKAQSQIRKLEKRVRSRVILLSTELGFGKIPNLANINFRSSYTA